MDNNAKYKSLVLMLLQNITPDKRQEILEYLLQINSKLLNSSNTFNKVYEEDMRIGKPSSRKKDLSEQYHPSYNYENNSKIDQIDVDDIIDDICKESESDILDIKLKKLKHLQDRILDARKNKKK